MPVRRGHRKAVLELCVNFLLRHDVEARNRAFEPGIVGHPNGSVRRREQRVDPGFPADGDDMPGPKPVVVARHARVGPRDSDGEILCHRVILASSPIHNPPTISTATPPRSARAYSPARSPRPGSSLECSSIFTLANVYFPAASSSSPRGPRLTPPYLPG